MVHRELRKPYTLSDMVVMDDMGIFSKLLREALSAPGEKTQQELDAALGWAAKKGNAPMAEKLLAAKANPDAVGPFEHAALTVALLAGSELIARMLISAGATLGFGANQGFTPLMAACHTGLAGFIPELLAAGAPPDGRNYRADTALILCAENGKLDCLQALIAGGADLDAKNQYGCGALLMAVSGGYQECVRSLLAAGASPNPIDSSGMTPLHCAIRIKNEACVRELARGGADFTIRTDRGATLAQYAIERGARELLPWCQGRAEAERQAELMSTVLPAMATPSKASRRM